jgi:DNA-binding transcriptional ArsR family regulator
MSSVVQDALAALVHPARREILRLVVGEELPVSELAARAGIAQPATSQHLRTLREAGLVTVRVDGPRRFYRVDFEGLERLRSELAAFWVPNLDALRRAAEAEHLATTDEVRASAR